MLLGHHFRIAGGFFDDAEAIYNVASQNHLCLLQLAYVCGYNNSQLDSPINAHCVLPRLISMHLLHVAFVVCFGY